MAAYTARQAAERYRVHRTTVLYWASHGWLNPAGERHYLTVLGADPTTGAALFDDAELVTAEQETRSKRQRSHRRSRRLVNA
jgi:CRISPR/Cas system Type II protein with McrA/HNH and RuvC-like nuclease domain